MAFEFSAQSLQDQVSTLYIAYYGRAADPAGLQYWVDELRDSGGDLSEIIDAFGNSQEATARYGSVGEEQAVATIFRDTLNREPDAAGLGFYVEELNAGKISLQSLALDVVNGVQGTDADILTNKIDVATDYTRHASELMLAGESDPFDPVAAQSLVVGPTGDPSSAQVSKDALDSVFAGDQNVLAGGVFDDDNQVSLESETFDELAVGAQGQSGFLFFSDGIARESTDRIGVGDTPGALGSLVLSDTDNSLIVRADNGNFSVGDSPQATGVAVVQDGASIGALYVLIGNEGRGEMTVSGEGSRVTASTEYGSDTLGNNDGGALLVGYQAETSGRLTIEDKALAEVHSTGGETGGPAVSLGRTETSRGEVVVTNQGVLRLTEENAGGGGYTPGIVVGEAGHGILKVTSGGRVEILPSDGFMVVAGSSAATGSLTIDDAGSVVNAGAGIYIGAALPEDIRLSDNLDLSPGGAGEVRVGAGATLRAGEAQGDGIDDIFIGENGTLRVEDGGTVEADVVNEAGGSFITGNSPGWAEVDGDFDWSGDLRMEFAGTGEAEYDRLDVTGEAVLSGLVMLDFSLDEGLEAGDRFTVMEAAEGLNMAAAELDIVGLGYGLGARTVVTETALQVELV